MRRIIRLTENDLSRIVRRVIRENTDPLQSLIGKTAVFKPTDIDDIEVGFDLYNSETADDTWSGTELNKSLEEYDKNILSYLKQSIKCTITKVEKSLDYGFEVYINNMGSTLWGVMNIYYDCGEDEFTIYLKLRDNVESWFSDKIVKGRFTNNQLSEFLDKNLPCGGFDLSKSGSIDGDELGNTLS